MKNYTSILKIFLFSLLTFSFCRGEELIVHEWGTFTTLYSSKGVQMEDIYLEEEKLPTFVFSHPFPISINSGFKRHKGSFIEPLHCNVKMETPVLYFYSKKVKEVEVKVEFLRGAIGQWFPEKNSGKKMVLDSEGAIDFSTPYKDWITWKIKILDSIGNHSILKTDSPTWNIPRQTDSNLILANSQVEKYIFYRGLANFTIPLQIKLKENDLLEIKNKDSTDISFLMVYELNQGKAKVWWIGDLKNQETKETKFNESIDTQKGFIKFKQALIKNGLYEKEADAMLGTWEKSYFKTDGLRVFWIVPREFVDRELPLTITPEPTKINRVFVGRVDILRPEFEKKIMTMDNNAYYTEYNSHRYLPVFNKMREMIFHN